MLPRRGAGRRFTIHKSCTNASTTTVQVIEGACRTPRRAAVRRWLDGPGPDTGAAALARGGVAGRGLHAGHRRRRGTRLRRAGAEHHPAGLHRGRPQLRLRHAEPLRAPDRRAGQRDLRGPHRHRGRLGLRVEVPKNWNHDLVLWAHGFRGTGTTVWVDSPSLRRFFVERGFAWAASSYQTNGYDVGHGVTDTHALIGLFRSAVGSGARALYMTGASMGGYITAVEIEHYRHTFAGAMPICGVLGDTELFDHFLDANVTAAALTGTQIQFPPTAAEGQAYAPTYDQQVRAELPQLGSGFDSAFAFWNAFGFAPLTNIPFLFGLYPGLSGGTIGIASGNVTSNLHTVYQLDDKRSLSPAERRLNREVLRVAATAGPTTDLSGIPGVFGDPRILVLSMHDIGDLFVPFSMEQTYAR